MKKLWLLLPLTLMACESEQNPTAQASTVVATQLASLTVYKSPTCGCCKEWISHMQQAGYDTRAVHPDNLPQIKAEQGIERNLQSCHTAVSDSGYVFEGHVPAPLVTQFLADPPEGALGLSVPGMPTGSPGMEYQNQFEPYTVVLLKQDGQHQVYAQITDPKQQYVH